MTPRAARSVCLVHTEPRGPLFDTKTVFSWCQEGCIPVLLAMNKRFCDAVCDVVGLGRPSARLVLTICWQLAPGIGHDVR